jgi:glycosyltransferase involved in cell wall biosynthesis
MKNFNLLQVLPELESGGVEQGTIDLANYLGQKKLGSFIVSNGGKMESFLDLKHVKHFRIPVHSKNILNIFSNARKVLKVISDNKINIVHVRSRAPAWMLQFIRNKNFKTVSTFHNIYGSNNFFKTQYNKSLAKVDNIIAISNFVKSKIIKNYRINEDKINVINRGIDTDFYNPEVYDQSQFIQFLSKYNIPSDKRIILYPGRLTEWKGQLNFLEVLKNFRDNNIFCFFVGDDKNSSYTKKFIKEINKKRINHFCKALGNLSSLDLKFFYKCSDVIISAPLKPEGFGRTISESLSMKKIILSYDYGGAKDQLFKLSNHYKIKPFDHLDLKSKIDNVLQMTQEEKENLGKIAREHVIKNFSKELMLNSYLNFYNNIL